MTTARQLYFIDNEIKVASGTVVVHTLICKKNTN